MVMKYLILLLVLASCSHKVINPEGYKITVVENNKIIDTKSTLYGKFHYLRFSFAKSYSHGLNPHLHIYGNGIKTTIIDINGKEHSEYNLRYNESYLLRVLFKYPSDAVLLFIWENKHYNTEPIIINLRYYGD